MVFILLLLLMYMSIELDAFKITHADGDLFINTLVPPGTRNPQAAWERIINRVNPLYRDFLFPDWRMRVSPQYLEREELVGHLNDFVANQMSGVFRPINLPNAPLPANELSGLAARLAQGVAALNARAGVNPVAVRDRSGLLQRDAGRLARPEPNLRRSREEGQAAGEPPRNRRRLDGRSARPVARQLFGGDEVIYDIGRGGDDRRDPDDGGVPVS